MENWLGAGPSASGTVINDDTGTGRRYSYPADLGAYLAARGPGINLANIEELSRASLIRETLLMGFRYRGGPDLQLFKRRFGTGIEKIIPQTLARWQGRGFFETLQPDVITPSRKGLLFLNSFLRDAFEEADTNEK
jgi:oxygen-independent coproporphyrinogen-3 oxidase